MRKLIVIAGVLLNSFCSYAQVDLAYPVASARGGAVMGIATDWEAIGINPSNLGWADDHKFSITLLNIGINAQSGGLSFNVVNNLIQNKQDSSSGKVYAQNILGAEHGLNLFADVNWAAFSFRVAPLGGTFAINLRDRLVSNTQLGPEGGEAISGNNMSDQQVLNYLNGTTLTIYHYRELNVAFGREILEWKGDSSLQYTKGTVQSKGDNKDTTNSSTLKVFGGIDLRYIMGLAYANIKDESDALYGDYCVSSSYPATVPFANSPGSGFGGDLGLSALYKKWKFGLSVTDIGFIRWKQNYAVQADTSLNQLNVDYSNFTNNTVPEFQKSGDFTLSLPTKLRMGANYNINKFFSASSDLVIPLNKEVANLPGPYVSLAGQINLSRWIIFDLGFAEAQEYGLAMPAGISLGFGRKVHMYFGTNDVLTFLGNIHNPALSAAFGLIRVDI